jgi:hypothetical protein
MSAVSAARKRRAGPQPPEPVRNVSVSNMPPPAPSTKQGLTLPEVIALVDKRLVILEKFMNDTKSQTQSFDIPREPKVRFEIDDPTESSPLSNEVIEEFNSRFVLLTEEITTLKDIVLNLQSYTMSVNKILMEERIQIMPDLGNIDEYDENGEKNQNEGNEAIEGIENEEPIEDGMTKYGIPMPEKIKLV